MRRRGRSVLALALSGVVVALSACGGGSKQDANDPGGTFKVEVPRASFPGNQQLAQQSTLAITVVNKDTRVIPQLAVTIDGFSQNREDPTLADSNRPIWIVNDGPLNGDSALPNTWWLGPVSPGKSRTFLWNVTAVRAGTYTVRYKVAAGLHGKAKTEDAATGQPPEGSFIARVSRQPKPVKQIASSPG